jgi:hypothetical protein
MAALTCTGDLSHLTGELQGGHPNPRCARMVQLLDGTAEHGMARDTGGTLQKINISKNRVELANRAYP